MKDNKTARLEMRIRPGDKAKIMKAAQRSGISVAEYVLQCCKAHPPKEKPPDEFWNLFNELYTVFDELSPEKQEKLAQLILRLQEAQTGPPQNLFCGEKEHPRNGGLSTLAAEATNGV